MKWRPHFRFAMPGVIVLFLAAVLQNFIPRQYRPYVFASIILTLLLGLVTGQFRRLGEQQKKNLKSPDDRAPVPQQEDRTE
jgi:hypothetical protein